MLFDKLRTDLYTVLVDKVPDSLVVSTENDELDGFYACYAHHGVRKLRTSGVSY